MMILFFQKKCNIFKKKASSALRVIFTGEAVVKCKSIEHCCSQYIIKVDNKPCNAVPVSRALTVFGYKEHPSYDDVTVQGTCTGFGRGSHNVEVHIQECPNTPSPKSIMTGSLDISRVQIIEV